MAVGVPTPVGAPLLFSPIRAGELRHFITIQKRTITQDATGQQIASWSNVATVKAGLRPLTGKELEIAGRLVAEVDYEVRIYYLKGLDPSMKVVAGWGDSGPELDIKAVIDHESRHRWMTLLCKSGVPEA